MSAREHPEVVEKYLSEEVKAGRIVAVGTKETADKLGIHCSPFGVIPKKGKANKWRLIVDLSAPEGSSVNDGISKELSSLSYLSVDQVVARVLILGRGTLLAKMDICQAYRNIPVHPQDQPLLGVEWKGMVYVDLALPFGLRSAPLLFTAVGDALQWIMLQQGVSWLGHYVDDFVTMGAAGKLECETNLRSMERVCTELGMPVEPSKTEGPATRITFLGMELDSEAMVIRLPQEKLDRLQSSLASWSVKKHGKKRDLLSLIGLLAHACKAVRAGRSFLRRLIDLSTTVRTLNRHIRLNKEARSDIQWWRQFCAEWNGVAMMTSVNKVPGGTLSICSDASGSWGCGAVFGPDWFQLRWQGLGEAQQYGITAKELLPVVVATAVWGQQWQGQTVKAWCDNSAVVAIVNSGSSRNPEAMHLRRCLAFLEARWQCHIVCAHIKGVDNSVADALSRNQMLAFHSLYPQAHPEPMRIPIDVLDVLVLSKPDWTSLSWSRLWESFSRRAWPQPLGRHTSQESADTGSSATV